MKMSDFTLIINQDSFWNKDDFLKFLVENQGFPIAIYTKNEGICLEAAGIYKMLEIFNFTDVTVVTSNGLATHPKFKIKISSFDQWFLDIANIESKYQIWNRSKIFGCFYNRPTWFRVGLGSFLYSHHNAKSLINFRADPVSKEQHNQFDLNSLLINSPASIHDFSKFMAKLPMVVDSGNCFVVGGRAKIYEEQLKNYYTEFLIDLVAETWTEGTTFAPTEKTTRPINFKKPFIVYGSQNYLCYLRQMGFRTFGDFWDESYDGYAGAERYTRILALIDDLATKSIDELETMYWDMQYTLNHNHNLLITRTYKKKITQL
jgi:hypothetical protein